MQKYDDSDVIRVLYFSVLSPISMLSPAHISSSAQTRVSNKSLLKLLSHPGLGPDPKRAFVEAGVKNMVLTMSVCGRDGFTKEMWNLLTGCATRGLLDLTSDNMEAPAVNRLKRLVILSRQPTNRRMDEVAVPPR